MTFHPNNNAIESIRRWYNEALDELDKEKQRFNEEYTEERGELNYINNPNGCIAYGRIEGKIDLLNGLCAVISVNIDPAFNNTTENN